jgi:hypothetical protein
MNVRLTLLAAGLLVPLGGAAPLTAQMWFFPDYAVPSAGDAPSTWLAGSYGRGLNDDSGEIDGFGFMAGRAGETVSFMGGVGQGRSDGESETTLGGSVAFDFAKGESLTVGVQGGVGWFGAESFDAFRFPLGIAFKGRVESPSATIIPWGMPRLNLQHFRSDGESETETDLGASAGVSFTFSGGFGVHTALDVLFVANDSGNREPITFGIGAHYVIGGGGG